MMAKGKYYYSHLTNDKKKTWLKEVESFGQSRN